MGSSGNTGVEGEVHRKDLLTLTSYVLKRSLQDGESRRGLKGRMPILLPARILAAT